MAKKGNAILVASDDWQVRDDVRTLIEAGKIRKDKKRFAAAKAEAERQMKALNDMKALSESSK